MSSPKSRPKKARTAQAPQRSNGRLRVAAILKAAAVVIAHKGYEAATMAEIAASSDTKIGSLYRFFPNKEQLADTLVMHYYQSIDIAFDALDAKVESLSAPELADTLLSLMVDLRRNATALISLLEAGRGWSVKREAFRASMRRRIAKTLRLHCPSLSPVRAGDMAIVVLHNMKAMAALSAKGNQEGRPGVLAELHEMTRLYLKNRLKGSG